MQEVSKSRPPETVAVLSDEISKNNRGGNGYNDPEESAQLVCRICSKREEEKDCLHPFDESPSFLGVQVSLRAI